MRRALSFRFLLLIGLLLLSFTANAQTTNNATAFTYQGYLTDANGAVNATCAFQFSLYDAVTAGTQIGSTQSVPAIVVTDGVFSVQLDFGAGAFNGEDRFLQIAVDCGGGLAVLSPRQPLTPAPYAQQAVKAPWSGLTGVPAGFADDTDNDTLYQAGLGLSLSETTFNIANNGVTSAMIKDGDVTGTDIANGAITSEHIENSTITLLDVMTNTFWNATGNAGTSAGTNFIGTTDNTILNFRVNNQPALRLIPSVSPSVIGGVGTNGFGTALNVLGATIGGGGQSGFPNTVSDNYGTVSGGQGNVAGDESGSVSNAANATVGGGLNNKARASDSVVSGGNSNIADGITSTVGGGISNQASGSSSVIGGGGGNLATAANTTIGGGSGNQALHSNGTIGGGSNNTVDATYGVIGGGNNNTVDATYGVIGGGGSASLVTGNRIRDDYGVVSGGFNNQAGDGSGTTGDRAYATVGGGSSNQASGYSSVVSGGFSNIASGEYSVVGGGTGNTAGGVRSTIAGGHNNSINGQYSAIPGGLENTANGNYSFAAGFRARANDNGAFVWADSQGTNVNSPGNNTFTVRASGGIWLGTGGTPNIDSGNFVETSTGAVLTTGGVWTNASDRALKDNFDDVDTRAVLEQVLALPITTWNYKNEDSEVRHMGPVAQDFFASFGLGNGDTTIGTVDADGVALAAIQGLNTSLREELAVKDAQITTLEARMNMLILVIGGGLLVVIALMFTGLVVIARRKPVVQGV